MTKVVRLGVLLCALLLTPAAADAAPRKLTFKVGPINVNGYEVKQNNIDIGIPKPDVDGHITAMEADLVDVQGRPMPIERLMLHHIVFANLGSQLGDKKDASCDTFTGLDSVQKIPAMAERFYGAGEERATMQLPGGYGYPVAKDDIWTLTWMVMNHRAVSDKAFIQYTVTVDDDAALTPVKPVWLDVRNCRADPVYDVPGGGAPGSTHSEVSDWRAPYDGRIVAGGGHVHGGAKDLRLSQPDCGDRQIARSRPTWGNPDHPFYNVKPVLHEPGPINMSGFGTSQGFPVKAGERLRLTSNYDAELPHTRVMGIMIVFLAEGGGPQCGTLPTDVAETTSALPGRTTTPRVTVPLTGLDARGRARTISRPPGKTKRFAGNAKVRVGDTFFSLRNLSVRRGARVSWSFTGRQLHDVTVASGPRGFSSPHRGRGGRFAKKLDVPGTYRLFCSLHPVAMTQRITVRRGG